MALYLRNTYAAAVEMMGIGKRRKSACEQAIHSLAAIGIEAYRHPRTIQEFHHQFRKYELFEIKRSTKSVTHVQLFAIFPEANNMLMSWAKRKLQTLNSETAWQYLFETIIPFCHVRCNMELEAFGVNQMDEAVFMKFVGLKTLCVTTIWRWICLLGFIYRQQQQCYYTDGHEKELNVRAQLTFIFPHHDFLCLFDQSSGHTFKRENGLDATNMNVGFGGKNTTPMQKSDLTTSKMGDHPSKLKPDDMQSFGFPNMEDCSEDDGPFWMTKEEHLPSQDDAFATGTCSERYHQDQEAMAA
eukprot:scaffold80600_cov68-Attheya_sp.AAC.3